MSKYLAVIFSFVLILSITVTGCSNAEEKQKAEQTESVSRVTEKIYIHKNGKSETLPFHFVRFYDDNTFKAVTVAGSAGKEYWVPTYGTFSVDKNAIRISIADISYEGVILDDGLQVVFGNEILQDYTDKVKEGESLSTELSDKP